MQNFSREILIHGHSPELSSLSPQVTRVWSLRGASLNWLLLTSAIFSSHGVWRRGVRHRSNIQLGGCTQNISDLWHPVNDSWFMFWHGHCLLQFISKLIKMIMNTFYTTSFSMDRWILDTNIWWCSQNKGFLSLDKHDPHQKQYPCLDEIILNTEIFNLVMTKTFNKDDSSQCNLAAV